MGRTIENLVRKFFKIDKIEKKGVCQINDCKSTINGNHPANFERHIERYHQAEYEQLQKDKSINQCTKKRKFEGETPSTSSLKQMTLEETQINIKKKTIVVDMTEETLQNACVELVTKNGLPFSVLEYSGFKKIIQPLLNGLNTKKSYKCRKY